MRICDVSTRINYGHANVVATRYEWALLQRTKSSSLNEYLGETTDKSEARHRNRETDRTRVVKKLSSSPRRYTPSRPSYRIVFEVKVENIRERTNKISTADVAYRRQSTGEYNNDRAPPLSYFSYKFFF